MFPASESHLLLYYAQLATLPPYSTPLSYSPSFLVANKGVEFVLTLFRLLRQPANGSKNMSGSAQKWVAVGVARVAGVKGREGHRHVVDFSEGCCSQVQRSTCCPHREHCAGAQHFAS